MSGGCLVFQLSGIMTQGAAGWCVFVTIHFGKQPTPTCSLGNLYRTLKHFSSLFLRVRISDRARLLRCSIILGAQKYRAYQTIPSSYSVSKKKKKPIVYSRAYKVESHALSPRKPLARLSSGCFN